MTVFLINLLVYMLQVTLALFTVCPVMTVTPWLRVCREQGC